MRDIVRIEKGKKYKAENGKVGTFNGKWNVGVWGIEYSLEDDTGKVIGFVRQKNVKNRLVE